MKLTAEINCGDGAVMTIVDPRSFEDGGVGWKLRYGNPDAVRHSAASLIDSYDYLLSGEITMQEATRRLRLLRAGRQALATSQGGRTMSEWQPMTTAPKDGSRILVWYDADSDPYYAEEEGKLTPYGTHAEGGDFLGGKGICIAVWVKGWHEPVDDYSSGFMPGWWFAWFNSDAEYAVAPTHWMPLPEPPEAAMEAQK